MPADPTGVGVDLHSFLDSAAQGTSKGWICLVVRGEGISVVPLHHKDDGRPLPLGHRPAQFLLACARSGLRHSAGYNNWAASACDHMATAPKGGCVGEEGHPLPNQGHRFDLDEAAAALPLQGEIEAALAVGNFALKDLIALEGGKAPLPQGLLHQEVGQAGIG